MMHMRRTDATVWRGAAAVLDASPGMGEYGTNMEGPDKACTMLSGQMMFTLWADPLRADDVSASAFA